MATFRKLLVLLALLACAGSASPQVLAVLAVKQALESAIGDLRRALGDVASDLTSLGNSLQANAQNVIQDVDRLLAKNINLTFDRLDATELRLMEDVQALTKQVQTATAFVVAKAGDEARRTIVDADIAAYNASYSLPCRSAPPRVVASFPARLVAGRTAPTLQLRGNFLRQGANMAVTVNGKPARLVERLDTALTVEIPAEIIALVKDDELIASATVAGLERVERAPRGWGLFGCGETRSTVSEKPIAMSIIEPPYTLALTGSARYEHTTTRDTREPTQTVDFKGDDRCEDHFRVDRPYCVSSGTVAAAQVDITGMRCRSTYEGWVPSGDRCVLVRGTVGGCGARRSPVGRVWLECRGRGHLGYNLVLTRRENVQVESGAVAIERAGAPGTWTFSIDMPSPVNLANPLPRYNVNVLLKQGQKTIQTVAVSHANPNAGPITSRVNGGILAIEADPDALQLRR